MLTDDELLRYNRQIMLPELDVAGQERLLASRVLIVGAGGLGCPLALYLAAAGVGQLVLADDDVIDLPNLQRQMAFATADIGRRKVDVLAERLHALNPHAQVTALPARLSGDALQEAVNAADAVADACDNAATRFAINRACVQAGKPLVSGAAIRFEGQVAVFDTRHGSACYRCLYADAEQAPGSCATDGVFSPLVGVIGSLQAVEVLKTLAGVGESLSGRLLRYDALQARVQAFAVPPDPQCPVCGGH